MSKTELKSARCGRYRLVAQSTESLFERPDASIELFAEHSYLVKLDDGAPVDVLNEALTVPDQGREGMLRFGNFVGLSELDGRRLIVASRRLDSPQVEAMLSAVARRLASLPFGAGTPTAWQYERVRSLAPDALYHAFAFLRDCMGGVGPHDLPRAIERILAGPHETLAAAEPRLLPLGAVSRVDAETVLAIQSEPELLGPVTPGSPLSSHPLAEKLRGALPEYVRTTPVLHTTDNPENRFAVGALETMIAVLRRFERLVRDESRPSTTANAHEARALADRLRRYRRRRPLAEVDPLRTIPAQSTVLRARPGYRELLRAYFELLARTQLAEAHPMQALLELRDAADIYELWCYFAVVSIVEEQLGRPRAQSSFDADTHGTRVKRGYRTSWPGVAVYYNLSFSRPSSEHPRPRHDSYSVQLRPDISIRAGDRLHLIDAKLKRKLDVSEDGDGAKSGSDSFKSEDLHKMHAYRDALGADSVWVLYPGDHAHPVAYEAPIDVAKGAGGFQGVGAIALRPDAAHDGGLAKLLKSLLADDSA